MPGTNNFLQHNPGQANQETDPAYIADNIRNSGLGVDDIVPSPWMNKILYQTTTFVRAFTQMMANKGFNMSDADVVALTNILANVVTNQDNKPPIISVPFSSTPVFDASKANGFDFVLNGNVNSSSLINYSIGQVITFVITQGGGEYTFAPPSNVNNFNPIQTTVSSVTVQSFIVDASNNIVPYTGQLYIIPPLPAGVIINPMNTEGDLIYGAAGGTPTRLPAGVAGQVLQSNGTGDSPTWVNPSFGFTNGSNGNGFWSKDPTGKITQWGNSYSGGGSGPNVFALPIPFSNTNYTITASCSYMQSHLVNCAPYSVNQFQTYTWNMSNDPVPAPFGWMAVGY
jgi:hypothetical protein